MAFWIFKFNPEDYRFAERLNDPSPTITWTVQRYRDEIEPGDVAFLWETGKARGVRAVMRVDQATREMAELESEQRYWVKPDTDVLPRVMGTLTHRHLQLSAGELRAVPELEELPVFRRNVFQQGTNFRVEHAAGEALLNLIERRPDSAR